jgi:hypothetical protein
VVKVKLVAPVTRKHKNDKMISFKKNIGWLGLPVITPKGNQGPRPIDKERKHFLN